MRSNPGARGRHSALHAVRDAEWRYVLRLMPKGGSLLEIGAGTGHQARRATQSGLFERVEAVDLVDGIYSDDMVYPVRAYDGRVLPFADASFDVVYTSHMYYHLPEGHPLSAEMHRVLRARGRCIHLVPTAFSRMRAIFLWYLTLPGRLGMRRRDLSSLRPPSLGRLFGPFEELSRWRRAEWTERFVRDGWRVEAVAPAHCFRTGYQILGEGLPIAARIALGRALGADGLIFVLKGAAE